VDAQATLKLCDLFQGDEDRLKGYAEEVKAKAITRNKPATSSSGGMSGGGGSPK
jgi:hypothetical protein